MFDFPIVPAISIHALLAESDYIMTTIICIASRFLSTLSLRRATRRSVKLFRQNYISIHALLAESDRKAFSIFLPIRISIHALLAESDDDILAGVNELLISIHALLAESDGVSFA